MKLQTLHSGFIFAIMILTISACGSPKLLDIEKTSKTLNLSEIQRNMVRSKVQQIERIVEDYELEKKTLESELAEMRNRMRSGGRRFGGGGGGFGGRRGGGMRSSFQNKMQAFYKQHTAFQKQIDALVAELQEILDEEQQEKFADIKLPELKLPEMGRGGGFGGGRRRGSRSGFGGLGG